MKDRWVRILVSAIVLTSAMFALAHADPKLFVSKTGKFSVRTPVDFTETSRTISRHSGPVQQTTFSGSDDDAAYFVFYHDYPAGSIEPDPQKALNENRDALLSAAKGSLVSEARITLGEYPGQDLVFDVPGPLGTKIVMRLRCVLVKTRLYAAEVTYYKNKYDDKKIQDFLRSFAITSD